MSENKLVAELRENFGKGAARKLRAAGRTPAVIYGHGSEPRHIHLPAHDVALVLRTKNAIIEMDLNGKTELLLVKSASKDALTQVIEHIDLIEVNRGEKVHVEVPIHVVGEVLSGTTIDIEHKTVKLEAEATHIPDFVELQTNKELAGHHYTVSDLVLPKGVTLDLDKDTLIASVVATAAGHAEGVEEEK
jgi:large subunit ribosomal protein L25